jgi:hypothetical protein
MTVIGPAWNEHLDTATENSVQTMLKCGASTELELQPPAHHEFNLLRTLKTCDASVATALSASSKSGALSLKVKGRKKDVVKHSVSEAEI